MTCFLFEAAADWRSTESVAARAGKSHHRGEGDGGRQPLAGYGVSPVFPDGERISSASCVS
jgi:hypothetical protein